MLGQCAPLFGKRRDLGLSGFCIQTLCGTGLGTLGDEGLRNEPVEIAAKLLSLWLRPRANPRGDGGIPGVVQVAGAARRNDQPVGRGPR